MCPEAYKTSASGVFCTPTPHDDLLTRHAFGPLASLTTMPAASPMIQIDMMLEPGSEMSHAQTSMGRALESQAGTKMALLVREKAKSLKVRQNIM